MRLRHAIFLVVLLISSCNSDVEPDERMDVFQVAYGTPERLHPSLMSYVADNNSSVVAATAKNDILKPGILLYKMTASGDLTWGKKIRTTDGSYFYVTRLVKLPGEKYLLFATVQKDGAQLLLKVDNGGNILLSKKVEAEGSISISDSYANSSGNVVCSGNLSNGNTVIFEFNPNTNKFKWTKQIAKGSSGSFGVGLGDLNFITMVDPSGIFHWVKLNSKGEILRSRKYYTNSTYFSNEGKSIIVGDNLYLVSQFVDSDFLCLIRLNLNGEIKTPMRMRDVEFSDVRASGNDLLFSVNLGHAPNLIKVNTDLKMLSHKTIAGATSADERAQGLLGVSDKYITCAIKPYALDPNYGDKAINFVKLDKKSWTTNCEWPQATLPNDFISAITMYEEDIELEIGNVVLSLTDFEVQTEDFEVTKTMLCEK